MADLAQWLGVFGAVLAVFGVIGAGTLLRRLRWLTEEADRTLLRVVVNLLVPCFFLMVIVGNERLHEAQNVVLPPVVGFFTTVLGFGAALAWVKLLGRASGVEDDKQRRAFAFCVGIYNYGYIPIPLIAAMFDAATARAMVGVLAVHNVGVDVALWTVGILLLAGNAAGRWWQGVLNPPSLSIVAALVLNATIGLWRPWVPDFLAGGAATGVGMLGDCAIPMALLLIGATIADHLPRLDLLGGKRVLASSLVLRVVLLPVAFLALAWALMALPAGPVQASPELIRVIVIQAAMPSAVLPIVLTKHYGGDVATALRVVLGTSLVGLITIPLWIYLGLSAFGV